MKKNIKDTLVSQEKNRSFVNIRVHISDDLIDYLSYDYNISMDVLNHAIESVAVSSIDNIRKQRKKYSDIISLSFHPRVNVEKLGQAVLKYVCLYSDIIEKTKQHPQDNFMIIVNLNVISFNYSDICFMSGDDRLYFQKHCGVDKNLVDKDFGLALDSKFWLLRGEELKFFVKLIEHFKLKNTYGMYLTFSELYEIWDSDDEYAKIDPILDRLLNYDFILFKNEEGNVNKYSPDGKYMVYTEIPHIDFYYNLLNPKTEDNFKE